MADKEKDKATTSKKKKDDKKNKQPATTKKDEKPQKEYKPRDPKGKKSSKKSKPKTETKKPKDEDKKKPEDEAKNKKKHDKLVREGKRLIEKEEEKEKAKEEGKEKGKETDKDKEKGKAEKTKNKSKVKPTNILWELRKRHEKERKERVKQRIKEYNEFMNKDKDKSKAESKDKDKVKDIDKDKNKNIITKEILEEGKEEDQYKDIRKKKIELEEEKPSKSLKRDSELKKESKEESGHNKDLLDTVFHKMEVKQDPKEIKKESETVIEFKYNKFEDVEHLVKEKEKDILKLLHQVFQWYKPDEVMLSFNGGKDCTVVMHMLNKFYQSNSCLKHIKIPALYITDPDAFEEVDQFVDDCKEMFNIDLIKKKGPIKEALTDICNENIKLKAVFMGCRRTDPYCKNLKVTQMTDSGWPPLMRINPIIDWKCRQVWEYIYFYNVPYCILYQKGYTSIGNKKNTKPNPHLRIIDIKTGKVLDYRPGHELIDNDELERAGRF